MQADVILKEPPPRMPPINLSGGAREEGGAAPPSYAPEGRAKNFIHISPQPPLTPLVARLTMYSAYSSNT